MDKRFERAIEEVKKGKRFIVVSHVNPEGDAVGSLLGLALALKSLGKEVYAYLEDPVPEIYEFLPGADAVVHSLDENLPFDATFAVDCGEKERLGQSFNSVKEPGTIVNIDHHTTNDNFGDINIIEPNASSTGEMIFDLCKSMDLDVTPDMAANMYVAIHTDTGSFRYSSSTSEAFSKAGELVRLGADPWQITRKVYESLPEEKMRLLGMALSTLDVVVFNGGKVAMMHVTLDMLERAKATKALTDGIVNFARSIKGVEVGILFREDAPGLFKVSMRSKGDIDVSIVAGEFGGGGHRNASGFSLKGSLDELKARLLTTIQERVFTAGRI